MKTRGWILIFTAVAALCLAVYAFFPGPGGDTVGIYQDGELLYKIDLSKVGEDYEIVLQRDGITNTVSVSKNGVRMASADCPDGTCVRRGELADSAAPIVCLPGRVVIKYIGGGADVDAVAGAAS